jgi:hypothetical protein
MRAILIDPAEGMISDAEVPPFAREIREQLGGPLQRVATLPNGDSLNVVSSQCVESFCVGGSRNFTGFGIILGPRRRNGVLKSARSDLNAIVSLTTFGLGPEAMPAFGCVRKTAKPRSISRG